ncbi:MAG TPA: SDR family NAD(P)-dependent oxidoreductase, partial [Gemmatimonadaceae bacterium]|nr:SDR family NAD(P)-dependent oxidoreductase [Gemmatimonadaceae bacterium]
MSGRAYLITGGTGFIGAEVARRLIAAGNSVRILDDNSRGALRRISGIESYIELVRADVRDTAAVRAAARGVDSVIHLAAVNGTERFYRQPELVLDVAIRGTLAVIDACRAESVGELVLA